MQALDDQPRFLERDVDRDAGRHGPVRRHQVAAPDELIELDEMDMTRLAGLRRVEDDEQVIRVGMDLGEMAALEDVAEGQRVEPETLRQRIRLLVVT